VQASTGSGLLSPSLTYDRSDPRFPIVSLFQTIAGSTPGTLARGPALTGFNQRSLAPGGAIYIAAIQRTVSDSYTVKFDAEQEIGAVKVTAGALYADRTIAGNNFSFANVAPIGAFGALVGQPFDVNAYVTDRPWNTQFPLGFTLNYIDNIAMRRDVDTLLPKLAAAGRFDPSRNIPLTDRYQQQEQTAAIYIMGQADLGDLTMTGGFRVEHYRLENRGTALVGVVATPLSVTTTDTDIFPSLNLRFAASDDFVLRLSGQRGISRPAYGAIRVGASINDTASPGTIGGGNPGLRPEYTWGVDASAEYYLPGSGIVAVSGFYRWVDNVFYQNSQAVGSDVFNTPGFDRSAYRLTSTFNGENGKLYGVEFNYQQQFKFLPSPLDGFGFQGNVTLLDGQYDTQLVGTAQRRGLPFQGLSDTIANASLYYEKYGLSLRVSYQWRDDWVDSLGGFGSGESRQAYENLDVSVRYAVTDNFTLFADAANLTNAIYLAYEGTAERPTEVEQIGSRYLFGVRFNF
jgi:TonB-dependent receptor